MTFIGQKIAAHTQTSSLLCALCWHGELTELILFPHIQSEARILVIDAAGDRVDAQTFGVEVKHKAIVRVESHALQSSKLDIKQSTRAIG